MDANIKAHIAGILLFGDPRFNPTTPFNQGNYNNGLEGVFTARTVSSVWWGSIKSFCAAQDFVCGWSVQNFTQCPQDSSAHCGHFSYSASGAAANGGIWLGNLVRSLSPLAGSPPPTLPTPPPFIDHKSDFNGDGTDDIAWHQGVSTLFMLNSTGSSFGVAGHNPDNLPIGPADWAAGGNIDGTGAAELYWYQAAARTIYVLRWTGSTWVVVSANYGFDIPDHAVVGDFNGDGRDDIAWHQDTTLFLLTSNGVGFDIAGRNPLDAPIGAPDWAGAGNFTGSGPDDVYWHDASQNIYVLKWNGSTWTVISVSPGFGTPNAAVVGDFNGDGKDDIAWHQGPTTMFMLNSNGANFGVAGRNADDAPIGIPDKWGAGNIDGVGPDEVYWYQAAARDIYVLRWTGSTWAGVSASNGFDMPNIIATAG
jgi:hypothetical protein